MNSRSALAVLFLAILATAGRATSHAAAHPVDVVVVAGQSNAVGFGLHPEEVPPEYARTSADISIWNGRAFVPLDPGHNTGSPGAMEGWGPEVAFAARWRQTHPERPLYIIKYARGSSTLAVSSGRNWAPSSGDLFADTTAQVEAARAALGAAGLEPNVRCLLWVQGEQDAEDPAMAQAYAAHLASFLAKARAAWAQPTTPVALALISQAWPQADTVRAAQVKVAAETPGVVTADAEDLPRQADDKHYTAQAQLTLGGRMFQACGV